jgi:glycosyltransferase involved in cell wall biosynthesis
MKLSALCPTMTSYSVVIPAFNAERTLAAAIESVLSQTAAPTVVIVVDDGSTDRTAEIARSYGPRVVVKQQANSGPGAATTYGFEHVTTPLVACIDADDLWLPEKASRQLDRLKRCPDIDAVFAWVRLFRHGELPRADAPVQENWCRSTMMMHLASARRIGPIIDPPARCGEMVDWLARARELKIKLDMMPVVMALRRIIAGSLSYSRDTRGEGYLNVVKAALDRRRAKSPPAHPAK